MIHMSIHSMANTFREKKKKGEKGLGSIFAFYNAPLSYMKKKTKFIKYDFIFRKLFGLKTRILNYINMQMLPAIINE